MAVLSPLARAFEGAKQQSGGRESNRKRPGSCTSGQGTQCAMTDCPWL